ncbi:MAG: PAS domain S-box protein [Chitinivibrionales bacterium]|nr:PAS domain S-box protein [Chitinivibrionales bacterium]
MCTRYRQGECSMNEHPIPPDSNDTLHARITQLEKENSAYAAIKAELNRTEQQYETLVQTIPDIVYIIDKNGQFSFLNDSVRQLGFEPESLIGKHFSSILHPNDLDSVSRNTVLPKCKGRITGDDKSPKLFDERRSGERKTRDLEVRVLTNNILGLETDELVVFSLVSSSGYYAENPKTRKREFCGTIGSLRDITHRKRTERALKESERRFRETADLLPTVICEFDLGKRLTYINKLGFELMGYTEDDFQTGIMLNTVIHPEEHERVDDYFKRVIEGKSFQAAEYRVICKDGSELTMLINASAMKRRNRVVGVRIGAINITDKKEMEKELQKAQILESLGILAGGIGHDFNNILTGIYGNVQLAHKKLLKGEDIKGFLEGIEKASDRAVSLSRQLLTFSKGGDPIKKTASITDILKETAEFGLHGSNVGCEFRIADGLWRCNMDVSQISQVFNNLVINAAQAMPEGGAIKIGAENIRIGPDTRLPLKEGNYIKAWVQDHGIGIKKENIEKIFDPYFSTKQEGSGLGLAVSYSIISKHEGLITAASTLGKGTTFYIYLPAVQEASGKKSIPGETKTEGKGRVLLMDDDEIVKIVGEEILTDSGYLVVTAERGETAIKLYQNGMDSGAPFDIVILDLTVPGGMGGRETIKHLQSIDPTVTAVVSSGYSDDPVMANPENYGFSGVVSKPYNIDDLNSMLNRLIQKKRAS